MNAGSQFPDGSYARVFDSSRKRIMNISNPDRKSSPSLFSLGPAATTGPQHRRVRSTNLSQCSTPQSPDNTVTSDVYSRQEHKRSISMPLRQSSYDDSSRNSLDESRQSERFPDATSQFAVHRLAEERDRPQSIPGPDGGWWNVVSAVYRETPTHWPQNPRTTSRGRVTSSAPQILTLPPGAAPAQSPDSNAIYTEVLTEHLERHPSTPPRRQIIGSSPGRGAIKVESSPGNHSSGGSATGRTSSSPGKVKVEDGQLDRVARGTPPRIPVPTSRVNLPSTSLNNFQYALAASPPALTPPATTLASGFANKAKLGGIGQSKSYAITRSKKEEKDEEREDEKDKTKSGKKVMNNPDKWNRDLVANIMGPPAERK